jgi:hypothetical protein
MRLSVPRCSLQGIAERPLPCKYNVIQLVIALSRRKRGFKSRRGRQVLDLGPFLPSNPVCLDEVGYTDLSLLIAVEAYSSRPA